MAMNASVWQFGTIAGPVAAGLLHLLGAPAPFVVAAIGAGLGAVLALAVPAAIGKAHLSDEPHSATLAEALEGVRFILRTPAMLGTMSLDLVAVLLGGATALLPVFSRDVLHVGALGNGLLRSAPGVGAVVVALLLTARPLNRRVGPTMFIAVAAFGAFTLVFALSRSYILSLAALAGLAAADMISVFIRSTLGPLLTPPELRGRVECGRARLHRRLERAGSIRVGHGRGVDRRRARRGHRRRPGDGRRRALGLGLPAAPRHQPFRGRGRALSRGRRRQGSVAAR